MKKSIIKIALISFALLNKNIKAQTPVSITFDSPTFSLSPNSYYKNTSVNDWSSGIAKFRYVWNNAFGGYWESGTAYTNIKDTVNGTYTNLYGSITYGAYDGENYATSQAGAVITFSNPLTQVSGFFITNTTYAWKTIKNGNAFARKFGDTTGTKSGGAYPQGGYPDYFKLVVLGYKNGVVKNDSVEFYLADYRFANSSSDYVIKNWRYVNCVSIGVVDSLQFKLRSSDNGNFGMNTPGFFSFDHLTTINTVGITELENSEKFLVFPNPATNEVNLKFDSKDETDMSVDVIDITGKTIMTKTFQSALGNNSIHIDFENIESGLYFIKISDANFSKRIKIVKL
ncbi:MAG: DUF4465 domain-containing protein [Bacteroidota bacterium]